MIDTYLSIAALSYYRVYLISPTIFSPPLTLPICHSRCNNTLLTHLWVFRLRRQPWWPVREIFIQKIPLWKILWTAFRHAGIAGPLFHWSRPIRGLWIWAINKLSQSVLILVGNCHNLRVPYPPPNRLLNNPFSEDQNNSMLTRRRSFGPGFPKTSIYSCKTDS